MEKEYNDYEIDYNAIEGDFIGFLEEKRYDECNVIIDGLADQKEFSKALELCMKRCAAIMKDRMTLPANYGEEKSSIEKLQDAIREPLAYNLPGMEHVLESLKKVDIKSEEEVIF